MNLIRSKRATFQNSHWICSFQVKTGEEITVEGRWGKKRNRFSKPFQLTVTSLFPTGFLMDLLCRIKTAPFCCLWYPKILFNRLTRSSTTLISCFPCTENIFQHSWELKGSLVFLPKHFLLRPWMSPRVPHEQPGAQINSHRDGSNLQMYHQGVQSNQWQIFPLRNSISLLNY